MTSKASPNIARGPLRDKITPKQEPLVYGIKMAPSKGGDGPSPLIQQTVAPSLPGVTNWAGY